jgi:hypothetical protein
MSNKRFQAESFTPTKWSTAEEKATFANHLLAFIAADCPESKFTKAFYNRLSQCFGFIAHYVECVIMRSTTSTQRGYSVRTLVSYA